MTALKISYFCFKFCWRKCCGAQYRLCWNFYHNFVPLRLPENRFFCWKWFWWTSLSFFITVQYWCHKHSQLISFSVSKFDLPDFYGVNINNLFPGSRSWRWVLKLWTQIWVPKVWLTRSCLLNWAAVCPPSGRWNKKWSSCEVTRRVSRRESLTSPPRKWLLIKKWKSSKNVSKWSAKLNRKQRNASPRKNFSPSARPKTKYPDLLPKLLKSEQAPSLLMFSNY